MVKRNRLANAGARNRQIALDPEAFRGATMNGAFTGGVRILAGTLAILQPIDPSVTALSRTHSRHPKRVTVTIPVDRLGTYAAFSTRQVLLPPNPKELETATRTLAGRASCGTWQSG